MVKILKPPQILTEKQISSKEENVCSTRPSLNILEFAWIYVSAAYLLVNVTIIMYENKMEEVEMTYKK